MKLLHLLLTAITLAPTILAATIPNNRIKPWYLIQNSANITVTPNESDLGASSPDKRQEEFGCEYLRCWGGEWHCCYYDVSFVLRFRGGKWYTSLVRTLGFIQCAHCVDLP